jgi:hypothetical protein
MKPSGEQHHSKPMLWIRIGFNAEQDPDPPGSRSRDLMTKNCKIYLTSWKKIFFDKKFQYVYPEASVKDAQATGEASALKGTSKH